MTNTNFSHCAAVKNCNQAAVRALESNPMKNTLLKSAAIALLGCISLIGVSQRANAVPTLQLDIAGGSYDLATQTIMASGNTFSVYAYGMATGPKAVSISDNFFLSMALVPPTATVSNYGSFTVNGTTINVTADMTYGTPPLETVLGGAGTDPGDLASHSIFPTFFAERMFQFSSGTQSGVYNTQNFAGSGPQAGTGLYYKKFDFDISGLLPGYGIHFDLYNEKLLTGGDIDINKFAPFSHDAEAIVTTIPEPEIYAMLAAGLGLMGWVARRRKQQVA